MLKKGRVPTVNFCFNSKHREAIFGGVGGGKNGIANQYRSGITNFGTDLAVLIGIYAVRGKILGDFYAGGRVCGLLGGRHVFDLIEIRNERIGPGIAGVILTETIRHNLERPRCAEDRRRRGMK